ncbi:DNA polymerase III subunit beta [Candidatus Gottesmanbacteria bacterium]|nr:DNA polymerase III subunit beta [Candidatus Gottesmanbacteria bacterium]
MKAIILQENFSHSLLLASRFVSSRVQLPILSNFLLEAKDGALEISATNLELGILIKTAAKIEKEGAITVPARVLAELINSLPKEKIEITEEENSLKVVSGKHRSTVNGMAAEEFPRLPTSEESPSLIFDKQTLKEISEQVAFASSLDEGRPALSGVLVTAKDNQLQFVATDGFRLSLKKIKPQGGKKEEAPDLLIPARALIEAGKISSEKDDEEGKEIKLVLLKDGNQAVFSWEDTTLVSRLIDGKFPPFEKIIPGEFTTRVVFDKEEFLKSIKLAAIFARESANIIKIKVSDQKIKVSANTPQVGENENEVEAKVEGGESEIAFNSRYLLEYLSSAPGEQVEMELTGPLAPGVFKTPGDASALHIIMPVRVQG